MRTLTKTEEAAAATVRECERYLSTARHAMQDARWAFDASPNASNWDVLHRATLGYQDSFYAHAEAAARDADFDTF